ncbi:MULTISPECIES: hypothetical protein [unclassified Imperialibacter]|uniref:hypothetical protein n=1 Tax=unclassified Imperialibacter TaxID=2629706 RepID=UPI001255FC92|nr:MULTISPECIES: hypothetical protein [unclassified Imperialibacter]CAD5248109.1 exported hypothetical protein [Imperialibacter sp. 75]CAD5248221.1 exported hypothetical protein [Imperialibacter sp. 89]VVS97482.1 exported hypothetical protein [Imperialibacter sp. EC-SDR9]
MIKTTYPFLAFFFLTSLNGFAEDSSLLIHFNNSEDEKVLTSAIISSVDIDRFLSVATQTSGQDTEIQIVLQDPKVIGRFSLIGEHSVDPDIYVSKWAQLHNGKRKRILLLFQKVDGDYQFRHLATTDLVKLAHIPGIVSDFISEKIIKKQATLLICLSEGMNAIINAYDQQFKERLIQNAPILMEDQKYYKGYSSIDFNYYFFERGLSNYPNEGVGCNDLFFADGFRYFPVIPIIPPKLSVSIENQYTVADYLNAKPLAYKRINSLNGLSEDIQILESDLGKLFYLENEEYVNLQTISIDYDYLTFKYPETTFTGLSDASIGTTMRQDLHDIYWHPMMFKEWKYNKANDSPLVFESDIEACNLKYSVTVHSGKVTTRSSQVNEKEGLSTFRLSGFRNAQPTWCNVFARELSNKVFGIDAFPPKSCSDLVRETFTDDTKFIQLIGNDKTEEAIWSLINSGYTVYFVSSSHIETGFPDDFESTSYRFRHEGDSRYDPGKFSSKFDDNSLHISDNSKSIVVGAGASVGFKQGYDSYDWLKNEALVFLYLGYLSNKY